ncbi:MAG TPA: TIGR01777 family oxidoreductase [Planctomycetota bacterium]|nr:TIGR01777 family oxidoreductase [Planctomycetota bacterium]
MRIAVTGASGFIGGALCDALRAAGHAVLTLGRSSGERRWDPMAGPAPLEGTDAAVHLAGEPVAAGRWSAAKKQRIRDSRVLGTRNLVAGMKAAGTRTLVCASATGYYGDRGDEDLTEDSPPGADFLAGVCREWEEEAAGSGVRTVSVRIGIVLGDGGALAKMLTPFRLGLGGRLGSGRQWMSWIHVDDLVALFLHALASESLSGPLLGTSPGPVTNREFTRALGRGLRRWTFLPMPAWPLRIIMGPVAEVLLGSQRCRPKRTLGSGFAFRHPDLEPALARILHPGPAV